MRRSPNDPRQPQDQRLLIFLLLSASLLMFWQGFNPPEPPVEPASEQQAEQEQGEDPEPVDDDLLAPGQDEPPADAAPIAPAPAAPAQTLTIGSAAHDSPYRMMMTLTNQGAAARRLVLSTDRFSDIEDRAGSLGAPDVSDADDGVRLVVVGPGTAAYQAGLRSGDVVKSGKPLGKSRLEPADFADTKALEEWIAESRPGEEIELTKSDGSKVNLALARPPLQIIRPEHENVELFKQELPADFMDTPSLILQLALVGKREADDPAIKAANRRLKHEAWVVDQTGDGSATFTLRVADLGLEFVKRFAVAQVPTEQINDKNYRGYHFDLEIEVRNLRNLPQQVAYELQGPNGLPIGGFWYANKVGRKVDGGGAWSGVGLRDVIVRYQDGPVSQMNPTQIAKGKYEPFGQGASLAYAGVDAQYFSVMLIPQKQSLAEVWFDYGDVELATMDLGEKIRPTLNNPTFTLTSKSAPLAAVGEEGATLAQGFTVFAGPKRPDLLKQYYPAEDPVYSLQSILYYGWFGPVAKVMLGLLHTFYGFVRNYGVAIVLLTVVVRLLMFPLSRKQAMNMVKMQELKPEIDRIAEKYKTDMEKRTKAQQELFRKHNYNPMGGCLLMFVQLPVFLGLYRALAVDVELSEASVFGHSIRFLSNLAAPDMFYNWSAWMPHSVNVGEGFFGLGPYLNLLPIVTVVLFLLQQKMFMPEPTNEQAAMQQKMMKYMMGFMGFMFFKVPSGLCLYFITSSLWGITERKLLPRVTPVETNAPPPAKKPTPTKKPNPSAGGGKKKKRKR